MFYYINKINIKIIILFSLFSILISLLKLYKASPEYLSKITLSEKEKFLNLAAENEYVIFLQHDNYNECCTVQKTDRGVRLKDTFKLKDI